MWLSGVKILTGIHEDAVLILGLAHRLRIRCCHELQLGRLGCRCHSDPRLLWLCWRLAAADLIPPFTWELPYASGADLKKKKKKGVEPMFQTDSLPFTATMQKSDSTSRSESQPAGGDQGLGGSLCQAGDLSVLSPWAALRAGPSSTPAQTLSNHKHPGFLVAWLK